MDMGLPGPDAGKGGRHRLLPPGYEGEVPAGYFTGTPTTNRVLLLIRAIPPGGDVEAAVAMLKTAKLYPFANPAAASQVTWFEIGDKHVDFTPVPWEKKLDYWRELAEVINQEPPYEAYRMEYGLLASLGIEKGKPFNPDSRMRGILVKAAEIANDQMRVQSFADRRPDRMAWPDRKWEWATLRPKRYLRFTLLQRPRCAQQVVLSSPDRIARHVSPDRRRRLALLARHTRLIRCLPRWR